MNLLIFLSAIVLASAQYEILRMPYGYHSGINSNFGISKNPDLAGSFRLAQPENHKFNVGGGLQYTNNNFRTAASYDQSFDKMKTLTGQAGFVKKFPQNGRELEIYGTASKVFDPTKNSRIIPGIGINYKF